MAGDSYFGDAALGYIAGAISGRMNAEMTLNMAEVFERRFCRSAEINVDVVIQHYNELVAEHNRVVGAAKQWMSWGEERKREIAQLRQDLAEASQRAQEAEVRETILREAKRLIGEDLANLKDIHRFTLDDVERLQTRYDDLAWEMKKLKGDDAP